MSRNDDDAAVRHSQPSQIDLVITDLIMGDASGRGPIHRLCDQDASLPIIALAGETGRVSPVYLHYAVPCGARGTYTVPLDRGTFRHRLSLILCKPEPIICGAV